MKILIDNGHGKDTAGKRSPDLSHREYLWARQFAERLEGRLIDMGYDAERIVKEERDIPISERCKRVNQFCDVMGKSRVLLISIHNDAAGSDGQWHDARGWSVRVSLNAGTDSKHFARLLANMMEQYGVKVRKYARQMPYWPQNLGICRDSECPAVLCENLFMDNMEDLRLLRSEEFLDRLLMGYVDAIRKYINEKEI